MGMIEFDSDGSTGPVILGDGRFSFRIEDVTFNESKAEDKYPQLELSLVVAAGAHEEARMKAWLSFSPKASWRVTNLLEATGVEFEEHLIGDGPAKKFKFDPEHLVGRYVDADVEEGEYNNRAKNEFKKWYESTVAPPTESKTTSMPAKGAAKEEPKNGAKSATPPSAAASTRRTRTVSP